MDERREATFGFGTAGWSRRCGCWPFPGLVLALVAASGCAGLGRHRGADPVLTSRQLTLRGVDAIHQGRWSDAESLFEAAITAHPEDERPHRHYAESLWRRGERDAAIGQMEESLRLSAGDPEVRVRLGQMYLDRGDLEQAWGQVREALASHRQLASAWALRGDILNRRGQLDEALISYHQALSYEPRYPSVQMAVADIYRQQERPQRALATLQLLIEQCGTDPVPRDVLRQQGLALKSLGRHQEAIESLSKACEATPPDSDLLFQLAEAHLMAGDLTNAGLVAQTALAQNPADEASRQLMLHVQAVQQNLTAQLAPPTRGS